MGITRGPAISLVRSHACANPRPGASIYQALTSTAAQKAALRSVAEYLPTDFGNLFEAMLSIYTTIAKDRNKVAHWIWGTCPGIPDAVLLADPQALMESSALRAQYKQEGKDIPVELPLDRVYVWKESDFDNVINLSESLRKFIIRFAEMLKNGSTADFHALCREPLIRERLLRQLRRQKADSSEGE